MYKFFFLLQVREIHDRSKPHCFELFATGGADIIKACKTDSEGKVSAGITYTYIFINYSIFTHIYTCRLWKANIRFIACQQQRKRTNKNGSNV